MSGEFTSGYMKIGDDGELEGPWFGFGGELGIDITFEEFSKVRTKKQILIRDEWRDFASRTFERILDNPLGFVLDIPEEEIHVALDIALNAVLDDLRIPLKNSMDVNLKMINTVRRTMGLEELRIIRPGVGYLYQDE